jgi:GAF domain-containing protein
VLAIAVTSISFKIFMENLTSELRKDVENIGRIAIVPTILEVICRTTGLGFSAVARVTPDKWVVGAVKDDIKFGLLPGGELQVNTTICHEIRQSGEGVIIDHVAEDEFYKSHHTPAQYGFQSYISVPIFRADGSFWGTLCGIDPGPAILNNPPIRGLFKIYTQLISMHLHAIENGTLQEAKKLEDQTFAVLQKQLELIKTQTEGTDVRKLADRDYKQLTATIERVTLELKDLLKELNELNHETANK